MWLWWWIVGLVVVPVPNALTAEEDFPQFKSANKRESKEFLAQVGSEIIKAARSKPQKIELKDFTYTSPRANRKELTLKMSYSGAITRVKYNADIVLLLDTQNKEKWEVMKITYSDSNKSPIPFSHKRVQELIEKFND